MTLWLCGQYHKPDPVKNLAWEFQGIFSTKEAAIAACRKREYWIAPIELDQEWPDETMDEFPGLYYPLAETGPEGSEGYAVIR